MKFSTPSKFKDHGVSTNSCYIGNHKIERALLDFGSNVNLIPYSVHFELRLDELKPLNGTLQLADRSIRTPRRQINDVLVQIDK